jgi:hypothetical protein
MDDLLGPLRFIKRKRRLRGFIAARTGGLARTFLPELH